MAHPLTTVSNFTYNTLSKELDLTPDEQKVLNVFLMAYLDDFWQRGHGALLPPSSGANSSRIDTLLERRFVFRNILRECVARVSGAFFGKAPNWKFQVNGADVEEPQGDTTRETPAPTPTTPIIQSNGNQPANPAVIDLTDVDKALNEFWTRRNVAESLGKAFESRLAFGRGGVRVFIPTKFKRQNLVQGSGNDPNTPEPPVEETEQFVEFTDIPAAIKAMRVEFIPPTRGKQLDDGGEFFSLVQYRVRRDWETHNSIGVIEFSFVDDSELTWIGTLEENEGTGKLDDANLSSGFDLAGGTTFNEFKGMPYVTQGLYKNNQLANLALTCAGFSLVDNGFGEMILTNVELETERVEGPDGNTVEIPKRIRRGGGATQNFVGIESFDEQTGALRREQPSVTFREPTPMTAFKDGFDMAYKACLQESGQLHALISGDATASGESRIQALADFLLRISPYKSEVDELGSWVMTTVLLWAAALANKPLTGYTVAFDSKVHVASLSAPEKTTVMDMRQKGVISRETERVLLGVDDPALEAELVLSEQGVSPNQTTVEQFSEKLDVGLKMLSLGIDTTTIQQFLGYTVQEVAAMQQAAADAQAQMLASIAAQSAAASGNQGGVGVPTPQDQTATVGP